MKFENVGKWMKETKEDKLVFDNREPADFLDGDDEICTLKTEDDESDYDDDFSGELLDEVESDEDELESPDNEEDAIIMADEGCHRNETYRIDKDGEIIKTKVVTAKEAMDFISQQQKQDKEKGEKHDYEVFSESSQKNEAIDITKLKEELKYLSHGYGWEELSNFADGLNITNLNELEKAIVSTGLAKIKQAKDIKNTKHLEDFDINDFESPNDKVIITKLLGGKFRDESSQKNEGPEEFKTNEYKEDFFEYKNGGHGSFMEYLAKACMLADKKNLAKIQKEFPELTKSFCLWKSSGRIDKAEKL